MWTGNGARGGDIAGGHFGELAGSAGAGRLGSESGPNPPNAHVAPLGEVKLPNPHDAPAFIAQCTVDGINPAQAVNTALCHSAEIPVRNDLRSKGDGVVVFLSVKHRIVRDVKLGMPFNYQ